MEVIFREEGSKSGRGEKFSIGWWLLEGEPEAKQGVASGSSTSCLELVSFGVCIFLVCS